MQPAQDQDTLLPIPVRLQWENHHGYCGETALQSCLLYYGSYASQVQLRAIAGSELLIGENDEKAFNKVKVTFESWDNEHKKKPQIQNYLQWIKQKISSRCPVIVTGYHAEEKNDEYDHIFLAVGFEADNQQHYSDNDVLVYTDHFQEDYVKTPFGKIWDTRAMNGNGKHIQFAFPRDTCYGVAITGIVGSENFYEISIDLQENSEPNVTEGEAATDLTLVLKVRGLAVGNKYALLRYDNWSEIPSSLAEVQTKKVTKMKEFTAHSSSYVTEQTVRSDSCAFFRCIDI